MPSRRAARAAALGLWLAAMALAVPAQAQPKLSEYQVKAGFLYNFANLVEWPAGTPPTLSLCLAGEDPLGSAGDLLNGKTVGRRTLQVRRNVPDAELPACQIVFIAGAQAARVKSLLALLGGRPILTVGDDPGLAAQGLVAGFYREGDKIRFEINVDAARRAQLTISSRLLQLARIVNDQAAAR